MRNIFIFFIIISLNLSWCIAQDTFIYRGKTKENAPILDIQVQPELSSNFICKLPPNQDLYVLAKKNEWVKIQTMRGTKGWILEKYVEKYPNEHRFASEIYWEMKAEALKPPKRSPIQIGIRGNYNTMPAKTIDNIESKYSYGAGFSVAYNWNRYGSITLDGLYETSLFNYYVKTEKKDYEHAINYINLPLMLRLNNVYMGYPIYGEYGINYGMFLNPNDLIAGKYNFNGEPYYRDNKFEALLGFGFHTESYHFGFRLFWDAEGIFDSEKFSNTGTMRLTLTFGLFLLNI